MIGLGLFLILQTANANDCVSNINSSITKRWNEYSKHLSYRPQPTVYYDKSGLLAVKFIHSKKDFKRIYKTSDRDSLFLTHDEFLELVANKKGDKWLLRPEQYSCYSDKLISCSEKGDLTDLAKEMTQRLEKFKKVIAPLNSGELYISGELLNPATKINSSIYITYDERGERSQAEISKYMFYSVCFKNNVEDESCVLTETAQGNHINWVGDTKVAKVIANFDDEITQKSTTEVIFKDGPGNKSDTIKIGERKYSTGEDEDKDTEYVTINFLLEKEDTEISLMPLSGEDLLHSSPSKNTFKFELPIESSSYLAKCTNKYCKPVHVDISSDHAYRRYNIDLDVRKKENNLTIYIQPIDQLGELDYPTIETTTRCGDKIFKDGPAITLNPLELSGVSTCEISSILDDDIIINSTLDLKKYTSESSKAKVHTKTLKFGTEDYSVSHSIESLPSNNLARISFKMKDKTGKEVENGKFKSEFKCNNKSTEHKYNQRGYYFVDLKDSWEKDCSIEITDGVDTKSIKVAQEKSRIQLSKIKSNRNKDDLEIVIKASKGSPKINVKCKSDKKTKEFLVKSNTPKKVKLPSKEAYKCIVSAKESAYHTYNKLNFKVPENKFDKKLRLEVSNETKDMETEKNTFISHFCRANVYDGNKLVDYADLKSYNSSLQSKPVGEGTCVNDECGALSDESKPSLLTQLFNMPTKSDPVESKFFLFKDGKLQDSKSCYSSFEIHPKIRTGSDIPPNLMLNMKIPRRRIIMSNGFF